MRIRWRNLELPTRVVADKNNLTSNEGKFVIEPFEQGFGQTVGIGLRRILLSAIEGAAVTSVKIKGIDHEFSTLSGVMEDTTNIIVNIKKIRIQTDSELPIKLYIKANSKGQVTAGDIDTAGQATIINKDIVIATLAEDIDFEAELEVQRGRGYVTADENIKEPQEIGVIPIASLFSPVTHVRFWIENTRVGKITNYDRLVLSITTDGTISPEIALVEASKIFRKHLNPFVQYFELGNEIQQEEIEKVEPVQEEDQNQQKLMEKLELPIETLDLGVRSSNCLSSIRLRTIRDLVSLAESELLKIKNFGKTSLNEIKDKLKSLDLTLGMQLGDDSSEAVM